MQKDVSQPTDDAETQSGVDQSRSDDAIAENKQADPTNEPWTDPDAQQSADAGAIASVNATNGNYPNMAFGGDMDQMQMMMAMQNGMMPNAFAGYPMIGLSCPPRSCSQRTSS